MPAPPVTSLIGIRSPWADTGIVVKRIANSTKLANRDLAKTFLVFIFFL
jgi:hypothetical protein